MTDERSVPQPPSLTMEGIVMESGAELHVTEWGDDGPRVVLIHGGSPGGGQGAFPAQQELQERWHLVLPDRPGHGSSPRQGREDFERDAALLAPMLGTRAHLVGHSYGAIVALYIAAQRQDAVASLTLIEPPAFWFAPDDPVVAEMSRKNQELFEAPPSDPAQLVRSFFALIGIDLDLPDSATDMFVIIAQGLADIRGPWEGRVAASDLASGGYPIQVLTSGRIAGFEGIAAAMADQVDAEHHVVAGTDHSVQNARAPVNELLEQLWLKGDSAAMRAEGRGEWL